VAAVLPLAILAFVALFFLLLSRRGREPAETEVALPAESAPASGPPAEAPAEPARAEPPSPAGETYVPAASAPAEGPTSSPASEQAEGRPAWRPTVRETLPSEMIQRLQLQISAFPDLPAVTRQILLALQNPETSPQQLSRLAGSDPALAARILRVVNSAFYNLPCKVADVSRAIVLLGYMQVRNLVMHGGVGTVLVARDRKTPVDLQPFWYHSFCSATCAFHFARATGTLSPGLASTVGLLHDIGKPVWWWAGMTGAAPPFPGTGLSDEGSLREEEGRFGASHAVAGALLAVRWGLPAEVVRGIEYHHHPPFVDPDSLPGDVRELAVVLSLADAVAHWFESLSEEEAAAGDMSGASRVIEEAWFRSGGKLGAVVGLVDPLLHRDLLRARALMEQGAADAEPVAETPGPRRAG